MNTKPTSARPIAFPARARFVLVRDRVPRTGANCALCCAKIESGYVREPQSRLVYCNLTCFAGHEKTADDHPCESREQSIMKYSQRTPSTPSVGSMPALFY
jgi:hypothetical protein